MDDIKNNTYEKFEVWPRYIPYLQITGYKVNLKKISDIKKARLFKRQKTYSNQAGETVYSGFFYNYFTWEKTPFYRYVTFTWVYFKPDWLINSDQLLKLNSKVFYSLWSLTGEVVLSSFIGNRR
jgi:hypothetical protein